MTRRPHRLICCFIVGFIIFSSINTFAQEARLTNIIVTNSRDDLLVYLNVEGAFRDKIKKAILSGVPTTFSFYTNIYKLRGFWLDKKLASIKTMHTIKYNSLKKNFTVTRPWDNNSPITTQSFSEAQSLMTEIDSLKVIELDKMQKGHRYQIRAKAELSKRTLPLHLHYILFFMSLWDFKTDWYTLDFMY